MPHELSSDTDFLMQSKWFFYPVESDQSGGGRAKTLNAFDVKLCSERIIGHYKQSSEAADHNKPKEVMLWQHRTKIQRTTQAKILSLSLSVSVSMTKTVVHTWMPMATMFIPHGRKEG